MSQTKRISRNTRSVRLKRAESQPVTAPGSEPVVTPSDTAVRAKLVQRIRTTVRDENFDLDGAFKSAMRRMIEVEIDDRH